MIPAIEHHRSEIEQLCRRHGVKRLDLFGSAARNEFDPTRSDLDFFVEFLDPNWNGLSERFFGLLHGLEDILKHPIDLVERAAVQNMTFLRVAQRDLESIYAASGSARKLIEDMQAAAADIAAFTKTKLAADFLADKQLRWSVERGFEIVGEALTQLSKLDSVLAAQITDHRKIISFRNVLIHGYDHINPGITWGVVQNNLPTLRHELEELLK